MGRENPKMKQDFIVLFKIFCARDQFKSRYSKQRKCDEASRLARGKPLERQVRLPPGGMAEVRRQRAVRRAKRKSQKSNVERFMLFRGADGADMPGKYFTLLKDPNKKLQFKILAECEKNGQKYLKLAYAGGGKFVTSMEKLDSVWVRAMTKNRNTGEVHPTLVAA